MRKSLVTSQSPGGESENSPEMAWPSVPTPPRDRFSPSIPTSKARLSLGSRRGHDSASKAAASSSKKAVGSEPPPPRSTARANENCGALAGLYSPISRCKTAVCGACCWVTQLPCCLPIDRHLASSKNDGVGVFWDSRWASGQVRVSAQRAMPATTTTAKTRRIFPTCRDSQ